MNETSKRIFCLYPRPCICPTCMEPVLKGDVLITLGKLHGTPKLSDPTATIKV